MHTGQIVVAVEDFHAYGEHLIVKGNLYILSHSADDHPNMKGEIGGAFWVCNEANTLSVYPARFFERANINNIRIGD